MRGSLETNDRRRDRDGSLWSRRTTAAPAASPGASESFSRGHRSRGEPMANQPARRRTRRRARPRRAVAARTPPLANVLRRVCAELTAAEIRYALVGGLAVSARAEPRLTRDVDLAIAAADDDAAEAIVRALASRGYQVATVLEHTGTGRLATVRLSAPDGRVLVDLLFASCGIESEIVAAAQPLEITTRGFARRRDLRAAWRKVQVSSSSRSRSRARNA